MDIVSVEYNDGELQVIEFESTEVSSISQLVWHCIDSKIPFTITYR